MRRVTKTGLCADIGVLTTMWGAGNPADYEVGEAHEKALLVLLRRLVRNTPMADLQAMIKSSGFDKANDALLDHLENGR